MRPLHVIPFHLGIEPDHRQVAAECGIALRTAVGKCVLTRHTGRDRPVVIEEPFRGQAPARVTDVVEVALFLARVVEQLEPRRGAKHVVDEPAVLGREAHQPDGERITDREVGHGADVVAHVAVGARAQHDVDVGVKRGRVRLVGHDAQGTRLGTGAVERALRATQGLYALDIHHARVRSTVHGQRLFIEIQRR